MRLSRASLRAHVVDELLPLWASHGLDRNRGGYWNRLDESLTPVPDGWKRLLVHARQIYAFSIGVELGAGDWARQAVSHGLEFLSSFRDARHGGWFLTTTDAGEPLDRRKDLYAHAFVVFALSEHARVFRDRESLRQARETLEIIRAKLRDPKAGGFRESATEDWQPIAGPRLQNPHMHLFEALLSLHGAAPGEGALEEAAGIFDLLESRWVDPSGALGEVFDSSWTPAPGEAGRGIEPGHCFEWFALLHRFGTPAAKGLAERLFAFGARHGVDSDGGVFDKVDRAGKPLDANKRLWPQTERLKALAVRGSRAELEAALEHCAKRYVDPVTHGWREHLERDGRPLTRAQNATSVYHVVTALTEAMGSAE